MSPSTSLKTLVRVALPVALAGAVLSVPTAAQAANSWTTVSKMHGAKAQVCKAPAFRGWTVKIRVNNRAGGHWHRASLSNNAGTRRVEARVGAGGISKVKSIFSTKGVSVGMGDAKGDHGGWMPMSHVGRC